MKGDVIIRRCLALVRPSWTFVITAPALKYFKLFPTAQARVNARSSITAIPAFSYSFKSLLGTYPGNGVNFALRTPDVSRSLEMFNMDDHFTVLRSLACALIGTLSQTADWCCKKIADCDFQE